MKPVVACLVAVPRRIVFGRYNETPTLLSPFVNGLDNIDQLLLILQHPVHFVVVAGSKITHHVLVPEEEHECHVLVQLVHLVEILDLFEITDVDDSEVLDTVCYAIKDLILAHAVRVPVFTKSYDYETFVFGHDGLVDVPACDEVGKDHGTHDGVERAFASFCAALGVFVEFSECEMGGVCCMVLPHVRKF